MTSIFFLEILERSPKTLRPSFFGPQKNIFEPAVMAANRQANRWESDGESSDDDDDDLPRRKKRCLMLAAAVAVLVDAPTQHSGPRGPKRRQQMCFVWAEHCLRLNASEFRARYRLDYESFNAPLLETKPPAPLASFLAAAHAHIIAAEGSAALSRGSRGPRERAKVLLSPPIYPLLLHALHHSSVSASSPLSPRETHHKSYTSRIKHAGTRAPGTPSFAMGGEKNLSSKIEVFFDLCN